MQGRKGKKKCCGILITRLIAYLDAGDFVGRHGSCRSPVPDGNRAVLREADGDEIFASRCKANQLHTKFVSLHTAEER